MTRPAPLAVSLHMADKLLGKRNGSAAELVRSGRLRPIPWGERVRVLRSDVERVAGEGFTPAGRRPRVRRSSPPTGDVVKAIRALDLEAL